MINHEENRREERRSRKAAQKVVQKKLPKFENDPFELSRFCAHISEGEQTKINIQPTKQNLPPIVFSFSSKHPQHDGKNPSHPSSRPALSASKCFLPSYKSIWYTRHLQNQSLHVTRTLDFRAFSHAFRPPARVDPFSRRDSCLFPAFVTETLPCRRDCQS